MQVNDLKKAYQVFQKLEHLTITEALSQLQAIDDITPSVSAMVASLLNNQNQPSLVFDLPVNQSSLIDTEQWQVGDEIGTYRLTEFIGEGGMAHVFKAERIHSEQQKSVAIKIIKSSMTEVMRNLFAKEQNILAGLNHSNLIDFHHSEQTQDGTLYLVMEWLKGALTIDQYIEHSHVNKETVVQLCIQAAQGLQSAHNQLVMHRDIKPSNCMVTEQGSVKILDFGIASLTCEEPKLNDDVLSLTPSYASPEQLQGQRLDVTTDVYSLALVMVHLLTGQTPPATERWQSQGKNDQEWIINALQANDIDRDLQKLVAKATAYDPHDRYQSMQALAVDLQHWLDKKPLDAIKPTALYRMNRFYHRRKALSFTMVLLFLTVVVSGGLLWEQNQTIKAEAVKANTVTQFMLDTYGITDPNTAQGAEISAKDVLQHSLVKLASYDHLDDEIRSELYVALGQAMGRLGYHNQAVDIFNEAMQLPVKSASARVLQLDNMLAAGHYESLNQQLEQLGAAPFEDPSHNTIYQRIRINLLAQAGAYDKALTLLNSLQDIGDDHIKNQRLLAEIKYLQGHSDQAIDIINALKESHPLPATDVMNLALNADLVQYYDRQNQFDEALQLTQQNIDSFERILGDRHPQLGAAYNSLSLFYRLKGETADAKQAALRSQEIFQAQHGEISEGMAQAHSHLGVAHYMTGDNDLAVEALQNAADVLAKVYGDTHVETLIAKANLATILTRIDQPNLALSILEEVYQAEVEQLGKTHRSPILTQQSMILALSATQRHEEALEMANENWMTVVEGNLQKTPYGSNSRFIKGQTLLAAAEFEQASLVLYKVLDLWDSDDMFLLAKLHGFISESALGLLNMPQASEHQNIRIKLLAELTAEDDVLVLNAHLDWIEQLLASEQFDHARQHWNGIYSLLEAQKGTDASLAQRTHGLSTRFNEQQPAVLPPQ